MTMKNMKLPKKDNKGSYPVELETSPYGFGLKLHICDEHMAKLGMKKPLPVGTVVMIEARAVVEEAHERSEMRGGASKVDVGMSIQITDMSVAEDSGTKNAKDAAEVMYD